jgi:transmembrane sensor
MPNNKQVSTLLHRYCQGQCSPEEIMIIENWYQDLLDKSQWDFQPGEEALIGASIKARMNERLNLHRKVRQLKVIRPVHRRWYPVAVAGSILVLVLAAGTCFWSGYPVKQDRQVKQMPANDVLPGGNKAVLTLANGEKIILEGAANGRLAQQGNARVQKLVNGRIVYQADNERSAGIVYNTLTTPRGGQYQLGLPDGTQIWLNAASSVTYPTAFVGKERTVSITGEAYFEVAPNARMPFRVKTGEQMIEVLGTHFNVNAYPDEPSVNTTLMEGRVKVIQRNQSQLLAPGEQASVYPSGQIGLVKKADVDQVMAWKNGKFIFGDKADIKTVMRQVARWYDVDVEYRGTVAQHFWGTVSRQMNAAQVFRLLEATGGVHFIIEGKRVIVMP